MKVVIYHNPRCSKSRQSLALLRERGIEPEVVEYLKSPPDVGTLRKLLQKLKVGPRELMRTGEQAYKALGLDDPQHDDETLLTAMAAHPVLIERPIVVAGKAARIGRPPEKILEIL